MSSLGLSHLFLPCDDFLPVAQLTQHGTQPLMCSVVSFTYVCTMPSRSGTPPPSSHERFAGPRLRCDRPYACTPAAVRVVAWRRFRCGLCPLAHTNRVLFTHPV